MRTKDYQQLFAQIEHFCRGGLPELGTKNKNGGYRWCVGQVVGNDGKPKRWRENLGHDLLVAQYRAREMSDTWYDHIVGVRTAGGWADVENIEIPPMDRATAKQLAWDAAVGCLAAPRRLAAEANALMQGKIETSPAAAPGFKLVAVPIEVPDNKAAAFALAAEIPAATGLTLHGLARKWLTDLENRNDKKDIGGEYVAHIQRVTLPRILELTPDIPIDKIKKETLSEIRLSFQGKTTWNKTTIKSELNHFKTLMIWADDLEIWPNPPRGWKKLIRPIFRNDHHSATVKVKNHDTYSIAELTKLYQAAGYSARLWILLNLNFAWGQTEIATARICHFAERPEARRVARYRHKRKPGSEPIPGRWQAWPETWELATQRMAKTPSDKATNPDGLAFMTAQGKELVRTVPTKKNPKKSKRHDAVKDSFEELCKVAGVRCRGFYLLRHTGLNMMLRIGKQEMADLYSQHAPETVSEKFYENSNWKKLRRCLRKMRIKLEPMFSGKAEVKVAAKPAEEKTAA